MVVNSLEASLELQSKIDIEIINVHTIKPLDEKTILKSLQKTKQAIVIEEAMQIGGLFSAISEIACQKYPITILPIAVDNRFGQSGSSRDLLEAYSLTTDDIIKKIMSLNKR